MDSAGQDSASACFPSFFLGNLYPNRWEAGIGVRVVLKANGMVELANSTGKCC